MTKVPFDHKEQAELELTASSTQARLSAPTVYSKLSPAVPSLVYDTYWRFAVERQAIFFKRWAGKKAPWTTDSILREYKFTNAYRASDRVSQYLIQHVIYEGNPAAEETFFRVLLFKFFNRIETWERLLQVVGRLQWSTYSFSQYDEVLSAAMAASEKIYSAAYIMPSAQAFGEQRKHRNHLRLLERMMREELPARLQEARSMRCGFELLRSYPSLGDFLAYQLITDLNYSNLTSFSEMEFVVPGPGARDGIRKCFSHLGGLSEGDVIRFVCDRQDEEFARLGLDFQSLWGRPLQLIDCQNLFCEVDKYARVAHPEANGYSGRSRIKQKYRATTQPVDYWYPPKWNLNERMQIAKEQLDVPPV